MRHRSDGEPDTVAPLLSFGNVSKRYPDGSREIVVLDSVSFEIETGAFVGIYGGRRSGKSTLLRLAAGVEEPSGGIVRFCGRDVFEMSVLERERLLRRGIALFSTDDWRPNPNERVTDYVAMALGSDGPALREARRRARRVLARVGMTDGADELTKSLSLVERTRVTLARALVREPCLLLVDEPAVMPSLSERDEFYALLRAVTREQSMALVIASEEMAPLHGAGVMMSIAGGELCSTDERGTVVRLPRRSVAGAERHGR
jgi:ABC-type multidrug transport system ATPase subunit